MLTRYYHNNGYAFCLLITLIAGVVNTIFTLLFMLHIIAYLMMLVNSFFRKFSLFL